MLLGFLQTVVWSSHLNPSRVLTVRVLVLPTLFSIFLVYKARAATPTDILLSSQASPPILAHQSQSPSTLEQ